MEPCRGRRGVQADEARDLTQGLLTSLLERRDFERFSPERGRFRAFLLASLQHLLANEAARRRTLKRGGGTTILPLTTDDAEERYRHEPVEIESPERLYERRWALTVIDRVMSELRDEWVRCAREGVRGAVGRQRGDRGVIDPETCPRRCRHPSTQMARRERTTRSPLQIPLECECAAFISELDRHVDLPWPILGGVTALPVVVRMEP